MALAFAAAMCFTAAALGSWATVPELRAWYPALRKPRWNPPNRVFGPVWTVLYLAMAIAAWLVWRTGAEVSAALVVFAVQLALNVAWSFVFFRARNPTAAFAVIIALWLAIAATIVIFWPIDAIAAELLVPYLGWVTFASFLNGAIAHLNPGK